MSEKKNIPGNRLSERLPVHKPDEGIWDSISSRLEVIQAQQVYEEKLANLPVHHADESTWPMILSRLQRASILKKGSFTLLAVAASLLLFFSVLKSPENKPDSKPALAVSSGIRPASPSGMQNTVIDLPVAKSEGSHGMLSEKAIPVIKRGNSYAPIHTPELAENPEPGNLNPALIKKIDNRPDISHLLTRTNILISSNRIQKNKVPSGRTFVPHVIPQSITKEYTPDPYDPNRKKGSGFALAANYLPEAIGNGNGTSMFHNVGLMASLSNKNTRIQSGIGMAYNTEHLVYDVNYTQYIPITAPKPGSNSDTTTLMAFERSSELEGTERHQYLTYDLGVGKKLFSLGKMTTWVNSGAGVAVKLDHTSLRETTIKTITYNANSAVNNIDLEIPNYNAVNINIMAGLDFTFQIMNHLSLSFAPTSRYYLKPVLVKNGSSTDSFTLGFRSGMKFDF